MPRNIASRKTYESWNITCWNIGGTPLVGTPLVGTGGDAGTEATEAATRPGSTE